MKAHFRKAHVQVVGRSSGPTVGEISIKEILVVCLDGKIDVDSCDLFRLACRGPLWGRPVLFNLQTLSCIGSNGLRLFLETLNELTKSAGSDVRFCAVRNDFVHVLEATPLGARPRFEFEADALNSFRFDQRDFGRPAVEASAAARSLED